MPRPFSGTRDTAINKTDVLPDLTGTELIELLTEINWRDYLVS